MVGAYTPFEVEAERRREVLRDSMRDSRGVQPERDATRRDPGETDASLGRRLTEFANSLVNRVAQRV
ncbi:MAG TPA: hypothetical protein VIU37_05095 [Candidatus Limnocylindrales bacterium]|jgi:hypothetical protein